MLRYKDFCILIGNDFEGEYGMGEGRVKHLRFFFFCGFSVKYRVESYHEQAWKKDKMSKEGQILSSKNLTV